ncbi:SGNH/GDSL hydrolase family protein [Paenibacillus contaminans]|uniref:SGNH/GDSL hydrolase family protein n=1 Tax=Paenibacillus contaminans TaxID=450362 RepID=A0A329MXD7_9BACL|nr:SGNH/GDSL hydrolase family protein [Paenibacillus contaminans]
MEPLNRQSETVTNRAATLFLLGDSISLQYSPYLRKMLGGKYRLVQKENPDEAMRNLDNPTGGNGGDSRMVLDYLLQREAAGVMNEDALILNCGLHDIKRKSDTRNLQVSPVDYESNLKQILALIARCNIPFLWIRTTPVEDERHNRLSSEFHRYNQDVEIYNGIADRLMLEAGVPILDLNGFTRSLGDGVYCDHVHYTEAARAQQAAYIAGFLASYMK